MTYVDDANVQSTAVRCKDGTERTLVNIHLSDGTTPGLLLSDNARQNLIRDLARPIKADDVASENWGFECAVKDGKFYVYFYFDMSERGRRHGYDGGGVGDTVDEALSSAIKDADEEEDD